MRQEKDISSKFLKQIGKNIKGLRREKKLSLEKLGLEVGLTRMQVHRIEGGYNITMQTLLKFALALKVSPDVLVKFGYKPKKDDLEKLLNNSKGNKNTN